MTQSPFFQPSFNILQLDQRRLLEISKEIHKEAVEILGPSYTVVFVVFFFGGEGVWYV